MKTRTHTPFATRHILFSYLKDFLLGRVRKACLALALLLALGLTEGFGILMLVPMLELLGSGESFGSSPRHSPWLSNLFETVGLPHSLPAVLLIFVGLVSMRALFICRHNILISRIQHGYVRDRRNRFYSAITYTNWLRFSRIRASDLIQVLTSDLTRVGQGTHYLISLVSTALITAVYVALALRLSFLMSTLSFLCAAMLLTLLGRHSHKARKAGEALTRNQNVFFATATEHLGGMKVVKSYAAESKHVDLFSKVTRRIEEQIMIFVRFQSITKMFFDIGAVLILSTMLLLGVKLARIPITELLLLIFIYARLLPKFSSMHQSGQQIIHMLPAYASATAMHQRCLEAEEPSSDSEFTPLPPPVHELRCREVTFSYGDGEQQTALRQISLALPARKTSALVGPSGSGKSTLADLLMGLITPRKGALLVDGEPLKEEHLARWRHKIGYVPQETFLFHDTIRANLIWARPDADEAALQKVLGQAAASEFVNALPHGLDTVIGDRGIRLSGGERQRLALARALLRQPELLILDEATSALDTENERRIQHAIERLHGDMTIVIIAHRLSTVRHVDHIVVLESGHVLEFGTWDSLCADPNTRFSAMVRLSGL